MNSSNKHNKLGSKSRVSIHRERRHKQRMLFFKTAMRTLEWCLRIIDIIHGFNE